MAEDDQEPEKEKEAPADADESREDGAEGEEEEKKGGSKLPLIIAAVVVLLIGGGAAAFFTGALDGLLGKSDTEEHAAGEDDGYGDDHGEGHDDQGSKDDHGEKDSKKKDKESKKKKDDSGKKDKKKDSKKDGKKEGEGDGYEDEYGSGPQFIEIPDLIVNLNSTSNQPRFLKLRIQIETKDGEDRVAVEEVAPRVIDQFQTYLRELRVQDLKGSAGIYRLRQELLRRVNAAAYPVKIEDILFQEILIQ